MVCDSGNLGKHLWRSPCSWVFILGEASELYVQPGSKLLGLSCLSYSAPCHCPKSEPSLASLAMSSAWHWPDSENKVGASSGQGMTPNTDRSRSPPATSAPSRSGLHKEHPQAILPEQVRAEAAAATCAPSWSTGLQQCDDWLRTHIVDDEVLCSFSEIPERNRETIVLLASQRTTRSLGSQLVSTIKGPGIWRIN